jgi:hypothetical protein
LPAIRGGDVISLSQLRVDRLDYSRFEALGQVLAGRLIVLR